MKNIEREREKKKKKDKWGGSGPALILSSILVFSCVECGMFVCTVAMFYYYYFVYQKMWLENVFSLR